MRATFVFYGVALLAYLLIDAVWLGLTADTVYRAALGQIMLEGFRPIPALAVYLLQVLGLAVFVRPRAFAAGAAATLAYGAAFGVFTYGLYDLTNLATLKGWTVGLSLIDIAWGGTVSGLASVCGWLAARRLLRPRIFR
ncbi:MAG TPA: DUF2177 family protein [Acidiphilium sp.]|jgi:uncharacterized membrane protein|uniref:DUF2177 family protein n=1 Tax=unclassified Acidiphilium TaxID=2617493 RepID=UPI000BC99E5A|nr:MULTISPECIES: DUF2177 family protein [unclassified Acidiphilium]OYV54994.1 MAG: hypothetical protein B7Z76_12290 [Acidiphilium sp. 20-67-58]HQT62281.1 DUF2177 family protein [Acidiphilium sp.]HQU10944.1 DUF2177 family protein [Acidiphilium sp.]